MPLMVMVSVPSCVGVLRRRLMFSVFCKLVSSNVVVWRCSSKSPLNIWKGGWVVSVAAFFISWSVVCGMV